MSYRIVWVDDTTDWVDSAKGRVEDYLREQGYEPTIDVYESGDEIEEQCAATDLDLIVVDYNLSTEKGDEVISRVRHAGIFTEVVFYSQAPDQMAHSSFQDGVFRCARGDAGLRMRSLLKRTGESSWKTTRGARVTLTWNGWRRSEQIFRGTGTIWRV